MFPKNKILFSKEITPFILTMVLLITGAISPKAQPYLQPAQGYQVEEILPDYDTFSSFDVFENILYVNSGNTIIGFDMENGEEVFTTNKPSDYPSWPSFLTVSPDGSQLWAGFTVSGNTDDRIFKIDIASGTWNHMATLPGNVSLTFAQNAILASGAPWGDPNGIYLLDTVADNHRKIIETGGSPAGFDLDAQGNLYYATYFFSDDNVLMRFEAEDIAEVISNSENPFLTPEQATILSILPAGAYDLAIDDAGNVLFTINGFPDKFLAMWNGIEGENPNYQPIGSTTEDTDWLTYIHANGDITQFGEGNEAYMLGFARPIVRITPEPPAITALPTSNIMGYAGDEPLVFDLGEFFAYENEANPIFEVSLNAFPSVAQLSIDGNTLTITPAEPGQTNIRIQATLDDVVAEVAFAVGVMPTIQGDYELADFSNLSLPEESFWNGSDESGGFSSGLSYFPNSYNTEWGVWSGWAYSNISDNTTPGWINQYSAITGAAIDGTAENPGIYAMNYLSFPASSLTYINSSAHQIKGMFITNATYTALAMMYGDDFSKKFGGETGDDPDWLKLSVTGMKNGNETATIDYYLADYRFEDNTKDYIIQTWQWVELSTLGKVDSLLFTLSSSDVGEWGMNTPAYFAADHIYVTPDLAPVAANPVDDITVDINSEPLTIDVSDVFSDPDDNDEQIVVSIADNSNPDLLQASLTGSDLVLTFAQDQSGEAEIMLQAISNGKTVTQSFSVTVLPGTGIADNSQTEFQVYPNPSAGNLHVVHHGNTEAQLSVMNLSGQVIWQNHINPGVVTIDITHFPAGIYMVSLQDDLGRFTARIMKQ
ncbi:MAG: DUF4465 domain-containing protein [Bacteroidota bacterium]